jgi:SagB-type dehydrogenase family enzyme
MPDLFRRSPFLVCYWRSGRMVIENYATRTRVAASPVTCQLLTLFDTWQPAALLGRYFPNSNAGSLARAVSALVRHRLLECSRDPRRSDNRFEGWNAWNPAAGFFHFSTKDAHAPIEPDVSADILRRRAAATPMPASVKEYPDAQCVQLPSPDGSSELAQTLKDRRTWRRFARRSVSASDLATLLGLSFGVQRWLEVPGLGRLALKTSPSGGSRHPIEAYVVCLRVSGIARGLYHYHAAQHRLELLRRGARAEQIVAFLNGQTWFRDAAALVLMTAAFNRTWWKYPAPRAYRVVLLEAGHVCQTFCLVATHLGLAPFCTMALTDSRIERHLGIDGVTESVLYAAGVGARPDGVRPGGSGATAAFDLRASDFPGALPLAARPRRRRSR